MGHSDLPLAGITVIDLGHVYNGPYATLLLALGGARVIKVEPPGGEHLRKRASVGGPRYAFAMLNTNKDCVTLDLKQPAGVDLLRRMARRADVLVENFRPGVLDRLGAGWDVLRKENERLVYAHSSGFGSTGPYRDYTAMDLSVQSMSGILSITGHPDSPPVKAGNAVCDFSAGIHLYAAVVTALLHRTRTGQGQYVEVSMMESVFASLMSNLGSYYATGNSALRTGNRHGGLTVVPYNVYPTTDGYVAVICEADRHWAKLAPIIGRPQLADHPDYATAKARVGRIDEVDQWVADWASKLTKEAAFARLHEAGIPSAPVRDLRDVTSDPHLYTRGFLRDVDHPDLGPITLMDNPMHFGAAEDERGQLRPSHRLGADNEPVYRDWLGLTEREYADLAQAGVIS